MPFQPLIAAVFETSLNRLIEDDPQLKRRLTRFKGRVIQLRIQEFKTHFTLVISHQLDVLTQYEGQPDCQISLALASLPKLRDQQQLTQLIKNDELTFAGDVQFAQQFAQLLSDCRPDVEEWLSRFTGDVVAHTAVQGIKKQLASVKQGVQLRQSQLAQIITEEARFVPAPLEIAYFCEQVQQLHTQTQQCVTRLEQLLTQNEVRYDAE